jgi:uncharacterized protein
LIQFAQDATFIQGEFELDDLPRLKLEQASNVRTQDPRKLVQWSLSGHSDMKPLEFPQLGTKPRAAKAIAQEQLLVKLGLTLKAQTSMDLTCQRCLSTVSCDLDVHRQFRFALDEAAALTLDDELEEDVLVLSQTFDAMELLEDELIMAMPLVAMHEQCPVSLVQQSGELSKANSSPEKPNPFAVLAQLKTKRD